MPESFARAFGQSVAGGPLFEQADSDKAVESMKRAVGDRVPRAALRDPDDPWWRTVKASDEFLDLVFPEFFKGLGLRPDFPKADYFRLVPHIPDSLISPEVVRVLDDIAEVASRARPAAMDT
jgi:hypothetical protein